MTSHVNGVFNSTHVRDLDQVEPVSPSIQNLRSFSTLKLNIKQQEALAGQKKLGRVRLAKL